MRDFEYCELWWSEGQNPQLTFYKPIGVESIAVGQRHDDGDARDALQNILEELGQNGWRLVSAAHHSSALFFQRQLH
jgi:hypothetical protein